MAAGLSLAGHSRADGNMAGSCCCVFWTVLEHFQQCPFFSWKFLRDNVKPTPRPPNMRLVHWAVSQGREQEAELALGRGHQIPGVRTGLRMWVGERDLGWQGQRLRFGGFRPSLVLWSLRGELGGGGSRVHLGSLPSSSTLQGFHDAQSPLQGPKPSGL